MPDCWQCSAALNAAQLFCPSCELLQPPTSGRNHFDVLGVPVTYGVDKAALEASFKALSRQLHPDRFAMEGPRVRRFSMEHATALNDAYRTLRDDGARARYLLSLWGRPMSETSGRSNPLPFEFLEEVMELREQLAAARARGDELGAALTQVKGRLLAVEAQLVDGFAHHDSQVGDAADSLKAHIEQLVHKQKYLQSILNEFEGAPQRAR